MHLLFHFSVFFISIIEFLESRPITLGPFSSHGSLMPARWFLTNQIRSVPQYISRVPPLPWNAWQHPIRFARSAIFFLETARFSYYPITSIVCVTWFVSGIPHNSFLESPYVLKKIIYFVFIILIFIFTVY